MTAVDTTPTPAPSPAEQATIARFGILEAEERVEKVARAIFDAANPIVESFPDYWERVAGGEETRDHYRRLAVVAIAALPASPAEVARLSPEGELVAIRRGANDWRVSNGGHYRDQHVADWTPLAALAPQTGGQS